MKKALILCLLAFKGAIAFAQNGSLKILELRDSAMLDETTQLFDSVFNIAMQQCDTCDLSAYTYGGEVSNSKRPLISINFISIRQSTIKDRFRFELINRTRLNDSTYIFTLNLDWEIYTLVFNTNKRRLTDLANLNYYGWIKYTYKNFSILHPPAMAINAKEMELYYKKLNFMAKELGLSLDSFKKKKYISISGFTMAEVNRYIGILTPPNYFDPMITYGGMTDPYNGVILSGIGKPLHLHELVHVVVNPQINANRIVAEGIASYYGGVAGVNYIDLKPQLLSFINNHKISSFESLFASKNNEFNIIRGDYIVGAMLIDYIKRNFGLVALRSFVRNSATNEEMVRSLEKICNSSATQIFKAIFKT